jgi:ribonuclease P protein component
MLAKKNRLTALKLKNVGRFSLYRGASFDAKKLEKYEQEYTCIISAKTMKKAVERNKVKRIFYRILQESIIGKDGFTQKGFLFYPKKGSVDTASEIIKEELLRLLKN